MIKRFLFDRILPYFKYTIPVFILEKGEKKGSNIVKKGKQRNRLICFGLAAVLTLVQLFGSGIALKASAASTASTDTANLRIVFTTDLHGQINNIDYSKGAAFPTGGLAKANTLIKKAREEVGASNTMTFDLGDVMYDYTTDYIYDTDEKVIQPIYQAMATIGYDAITLGNHDFEYTLPYIQNQLKSAGLEDKVVVSNVKDANTGQSIWNENKIIEKTLTTEQGKSLTVKVGIIGETIPTLSKKRCDYTGVLVGEDIVASVQKQTQTLKAQGADIVVVIAHSGVGEETPAQMDDNVGYALTKIDGVDVVLCGHKHAYFSADGTTKYDSYPGVDTKTGLVNGKNLVMVAHSGRAIGMVDLTLSGGKQIVDRKSEIRKVKKATQQDDAISNFMGTWSDTFIADSSQILCEMDSSTRLQNYFGTLEDDGVIQLLNDIGITYGMYYKNIEDSTYQNLPVVSAARYSKYGAGSGEDYYDISDNFTRADLYQIMNYRVQLWRYVVTGDQLKEWLEWSASAYETTGNVINTSPSAVTGGDKDNTISSASAVSTKKALSASSSQKLERSNSLIRKGISQGENYLEGILNYQGSEPLQYVLQEEWQTDWGHYFVLDGVEYHINTSVPPRYNYDGVKINDTRRVDRVTRNGQEIKDTDQFLLIVNRLDSTPIPNLFTTASLGHYSAANTRVFFENYLQQESYCGTMKNTQDNNWNVSFSDKYQYVIKTGENAKGIAEEKTWIKELLDSSEDFLYYRAQFPTVSTNDFSGPSLNLKSLNDEETHKDVTVAFQATDPSGINSVRYLLGKYTADSNAWNTASFAFGDSFVCKENGIYSVLAMDACGNKTLRYIRINNINKSILEAPKVKTYTNRNSYIEGTAEPTATVYFELENGDVYKTTVKDDGTFKYNLPPQKSSAKVYVYVKDDEGRASARTVVIVKRTGPNKPVMEKLATNSRTITGELNDTNVYPVFFIDDKKTVFIQSDGTKEIYQKSEIFNEKYKVEEINMNIQKDGSYSFELPYLLPADTQVKLRTLDVAARNSMLTSRKVIQTVPAKPIIDEVTNLSTKVNIYCEEKCNSATLKVGKKTYTIKKSKYVASKKMYRYTKKIARTDSGMKIQVYLTNVKGNSEILKTTKKELVPDTPTLKKVKVGAKKITGTVDVVGDGSAEDGVTVENTKTRVFVFINGKKREASIDFEGNYKLKLKKKIAYGTKITVKARNVSGASLKRTVKVS